MKFYYQNNIGDNGFFIENDLIVAIHSAWEIEADLYICKKNSHATIVFAPLEDNDFNSYLLEKYGYKMIDTEERREIVEIKTGKIIKCDNSKLRWLI